MHNFCCKLGGSLQSAQVKDEKHFYIKFLPLKYLG